MRKQARPRARKRKAEPNRENRPALEDVVGTNGVPLDESLIEEEDIDTLVMPDKQSLRLAEDALSVEPDELGAHFLREAVQDPHPLNDEYRDGESERPSAGEQRMVEAAIGGAESEGALVTSLPDRCERGELSELIERAGRRVRSKNRATRVREQSRRVADQRKAGSR
jgi:hypothetical protein